MESLLTIEEVAQRTGLTAHTLRYYERIGLIAVPQLKRYIQGASNVGPQYPVSR